MSDINSESSVITTTFKFEKETKGAIRYAEVDDAGKTVEQPWAKIGSLYLRKSNFARNSKFPSHLSVTISYSGAVEALTVA